MQALNIRSQKNNYSVHFGNLFSGLENGLTENEFLVIDEKVANLYAGSLAVALKSDRVLKIEALEMNKSLEKISDYVSYLIEKGIKRNHALVVIGGGIVQEIAAFTASILFRGLRWRFYPTTLLAQADSCIGGKSSLNVKGFKNQVGTYYPPEAIFISTEVLGTLEEVDFQSGLGEVIKAHLLSGEEDFSWLQTAYPSLRKEKKILEKAIRRSQEIKKYFVEKDEFDQNERLVLNYGHTFGHAIESATNYQIPHGIAVTMGMDMANYFSKQLGYMDQKTCKKIHVLLEQNYKRFENINISRESFFEAVIKDKKKLGGYIALILLKNPGSFMGSELSFDANFMALSDASLGELYGTK